PQVPPEVQEYLDASRGKGAPLPEKTRKSMEAKFQRGFADVRIHDDAAADDAARKIDALAFTRGNDIYFRSGAFDPDSETGKRLLAHELAHVVQQRPGINRKPAPGLGATIVRRATKAATGKGAADPGPAGTIDPSGRKIEIQTLKVPRFKADKKSGPYILRKGTREENPTKQRSQWRRHVKSKAENAVNNRITELKGQPGVSQTGEPVWYLQLGILKHYLIGSPSSIASYSRVPPWDKAGQPRDFDIDHKHEAQLSGPDTPDNMWLLDRAKNQLAGRTIYGNINAVLREFLQKTAPKKVDPAKVPSEDEARKNWTIEFKDLEGEGDAVGPNDFWEAAELETHLMDHGRLADKETVERLKGRPEELQIYGRASGGAAKAVPRAGDSTPIEWETKKGLFRFVSVEFTEDARGTGNGKLHGVAFEKNSLMDQVPFRVPIKPLKGVPWGGVVTPGSIDYWRAKPLSSVSFPEVEFDVEKGFVGRGTIPKPSIKLLENVQPAVVIDGDVRIEATIYGGDLKLPGPFKVNGGSLTLGAGTGGLTVEGRVDFEIEKLATGYIQAAASTTGGSSSFALEGELNFDTKMFTQAELGLSYKAGEWGVTGELAVGPDKIKGIKSASAMVAVQDDTVTAKGQFETSIKGVKRGELGFRYDPAQGMAITGVIELGEGIPGVKSGKLDAIVKEGANGYTLAGGVTIAPSVPGLDGSVTGRYEDGAFLVEADLGYEHGIAKGTVKVGVTNQPVGVDGKPAGAPRPGPGLTVYGGGTVTLTITPWLQGTVGLKLKPNGEIEVSGKVALPSAFEVFPEKKVDKRVFSIGIDIPIVGVAVAGQRIGIFATIRGGLDIAAGFGPGQLRDVALEVTYNPAYPESATVRGTGAFHVPARAGLRLSVDGGLGAGIPVVSATAGVTIFGEVGVEGAAVASAVVNWTPSAGIVMDAKGEIFVQPKFKFSVDAFVDVSADLLLTKIELYHNKWNLAGFEYGSDMRYGLVFPIHYESGKPFELSFDQIQWTYPQIDPGELLRGLMKQLVG
ncbi:MAG: DUF4157 domain-containing protein, partial [Egibacteraceae bacterium]